jgi:hypothetical protein
MIEQAIETPRPLEVLKVSDVLPFMNRQTP